MISIFFLSHMAWDQLMTIFLSDLILKDAEEIILICYYC